MILKTQIFCTIFFIIFERSFFVREELSEVSKTSFHISKIE